MGISNLEAIIAELCERAGLKPPANRAPIRVWEKSGVERLHLADATTVVVKYAGPPFTNEAAVLHAAAARAVPVPAVLTAHETGDLLVMLMEDLGNRVREPTDHDGALAAARLHSADIERGGLEVWGAERLAELPHLAVGQLTDLHDCGRLLATRSLLGPLHQLARCADGLAEGAENEPYGVVHGELHPTSMHIGRGGWHLVDFAMAYVGPGILDLATWQGTRNPPDIGRLEAQLHAYVAAGGSTAALLRRGGHPASRWALGWHRMWSAAWLLRQAIGSPNEGDDHRIAAVLRRQITTATTLLTRDSQ